MSIFQSVKDAVTAKQAALQYGIRVSKNNMACCPFHDDRHPSMKIDKGFYCFACGEKGDVVTFVSKLFHMAPYEAAKKLASDFQVLLEMEQADGRRKSPGRKKDRDGVSLGSLYKQEKDFLYWRRYCVVTLTEYLDLLECLKKEYAPKKESDEWTDQFIKILSLRTMIQYYLDILVSGTLEEQLRFLIDKGKDVVKIEKRMGRGKQSDQGQGRSGDGADGVPAA